MAIFRQRLGIGLACVTGALAILAVLSSILAVRYQASITAASKYNTTFDLAQAGSELLRLQLAVAQRFLLGSTTDQAELDLRNAILVSRLAILNDGDAMDILRVSPDHLHDLRRFQSVLEELQPRISDLRDASDAREVLGALRPFNAAIARLTSLSHSLSGDRVAANQRQLTRVFIGVCVVIICLVVFGVCLLAFVVRQAREVDRIARRDPLTGIHNRFAFNAALDALSMSDEHAVILVDVDHFKDINDGLGHVSGDLFLTDLTLRLLDVLGDAALFARLGGDEFAILFSGEHAGARAIACCAAIPDRLTEPFLVEGRRLPATVSMGVAVRKTNEASDVVSLMKDADIALYAAKAAGRARHMVFDPEMRRIFLHRQRLQQDLANAIERSELSLAFQPIIDLQSRRTRGFEALLRWRHAELGAIPPAEFIPIAEENGQILDLGRWVIDQAFEVAARWPDDIFIAFNLSARQFADPDLIGVVGRALRRHDLCPGRVTIEITESVLINNDDHVASIIDAFRALGVRISLDDFGTGYASLSYLRRFSFDKIKIDQSFVRDDLETNNSAAIIQSICSLAKWLGLETVAEGVETEDHLDLVRAAGCTLGQGYLFDRPMTPDECLRRLASEPGATPARQAAGLKRVDPAAAPRIATASTDRSRA